MPACFRTALCAVAAHQIPRVDGLVRAVGPSEYAMGRAVLDLRAHQLDASFDSRAASLEVLAEQCLGLRLRHEKDERKARVFRREATQLDARGRSAVEVQGEAGARVSAGDQHLAETEGLQDLERPRLHRERSRLVSGRRGAIDDPKAHAEGAELRGQREPRRPGPDDQHVD
jgi:hypothetical protein